MTQTHVNGVTRIHCSTTAVVTSAVGVASSITSLSYYPGVAFPPDATLLGLDSSITIEADDDY